jgi:hypothetical protein
LYLPLIHREQNMRYFTCLFVALFIPASMICAQDQPKLSPAQQEVVDVHLARLKAFDQREGAAYFRFVADDWMESNNAGGLDTNPRAHIMEDWKLPDYDHEVNSRDYVVHLYGNTAVLNCRATVHEQYVDADIIREQRHTETFIKQNGSWLLVAKQWTDLPLNFRKPGAVDTSVYKDYVGQYEFRPLDVETISVKDGRLWLQIGKNGEEYLPLGSETFFVKDDLGSATFSRDDQGHVTGYAWHYPDGQEIHVKKIK